MGNLPCQQEKIQNTYSLKLYFQGINSPGLGTGMGHSMGTSLAEQLTKGKGKKKTMLGATRPHQARPLPLLSAETPPSPGFDNSSGSVSPLHPALTSHSYRHPCLSPQRTSLQAFSTQQTRRALAVYWCNFNGELLGPGQHTPRVHHL